MPSVIYGIHPHKLLGDMRDEASVNCAAMQTVKVIYSSLVDIRCFLRTTDNVGDKFKMAILSKLKTCMNSSFCPQPQDETALEVSNTAADKLQRDKVVEQVGGGEGDNAVFW